MPIFHGTQYIDKIVDMPVVVQRMVLRIPTSWKTVEVPPAQFVGTVVVVPVIMQITQTRRNSTWSSRLSHRKSLADMVKETTALNDGLQKNSVRIRIRSRRIF